MKRLSMVLSCVFVFILVFASPGFSEGPVPAGMVVMEALETAKALDLSQDNLILERYNEEESGPLWEDEKYMDLLRAKIRIAKAFSRIEDAGYGPGIFFNKGRDAAFILMVMGESGSVDLKDKPFDLADYVVFQLIFPLGLEPLIRELPAYYRAVVSKDDWEEKFDTIMEMGEYPDLGGGRLFHLAGFPKVNKAPYYTESLGIQTQVGSFSLYEMDSSVEGWMYSFWMRRYHDGSMGVVKKIIDWLNITLDEAAGAKG